MQQYGANHLPKQCPISNFSVFYIFLSRYFLPINFSDFISKHIIIRWCTRWDKVNTIKFEYNSKTKIVIQNQDIDNNHHSVLNFTSILLPKHRSFTLPLAMSQSIIRQFQFHSMFLLHHSLFVSFENIICHSLFRMFLLGCM